MEIPFNFSFTIQTITMKDFKIRCTEDLLHTVVWDNFIQWLNEREAGVDGNCVNDFYGLKDGKGGFWFEGESKMPINEITIDEWVELVSSKDEKNKETRQKNSEVKNSKRLQIEKEVYVFRPMVINGVERDVTLAVLVNVGGDVLVGYSIKNPADTENPALAKQIAKGRAMNFRTQLNKGKGDSLVSQYRNKHIMRGIADMYFAEIKSGRLTFKGVK